MRDTDHMKQLEKYYRGLDRSLFLEDDYKQYARVDAPLPIGHGQTISQPSLVLEMTKKLMLEKVHRVLEIGTGSGYQTALLAKFSKRVYTVELLTELSEKARARLDELGFDNIEYKVGDGSLGWPEEAPFDRIIVTAAAGRAPDKVIDQLDKGGRMIIPVGSRYSQELLAITKNAAGEIRTESLGGVVFVEFRGEYGFGL